MMIAPAQQFKDGLVVDEALPLLSHTGNPYVHIETLRVQPRRHDHLGRNWKFLLFADVHHP
jgi:hypothetical protein